MERIITPINTENKINELQQFLKFNTKASVIRLALAYALHDDAKISSLTDLDKSKKSGAAYTKQVIFQDEAFLYFALIREKEQKNITDDELFPGLLEKYIVFGVFNLYKNFQLYPNLNEFKRNLIGLIKE